MNKVHKFWVFAIILSLTMTNVSQAGQLITVGDHVQLTDNAWHQSHPMPSPDGTLIVSYGNQGGELQYGVDLFNCTTGISTRLTDTTLNSTPSFSRDGTKILYNADTGDGWNIWKMNADGTGKAALTSGGPLKANPNELPDGRIVYQTWGSYWSISIMNADGSGASALSTLSDVGQPRVSAR